MCRKEIKIWMLFIIPFSLSKPLWQSVGTEQIKLAHNSVHASGSVIPPGDSPLIFCDEFTEEDIFQATTVDLYPNPPERDHFFTIDAEGTFKSDVGKNSQLTINATYNGIHSIDTVAPFCDHIDVVQNKTEICPPNAGTALLTYTNFVNKMMMPPGNYTLKVDARTSHGKRIFCVSTQISLD